MVWKKICASGFFTIKKKSIHGIVTLYKSKLFSSASVQMYNFSIVHQDKTVIGFLEKAVEGCFAIA